MAFALVSRSRSKTQGSVKPVPKQKSARVQRLADSRFGFAKPVVQPHAAALPTVPVIQAKLKVGEPNDQFEQEADRGAELTENGNGSISPSAAAQSRSPVGSLQRLYGNQPVLQMWNGSGGPPAPSVPLRPSQGGILQRKCACGGAPGMLGECEECSKKQRLGLQTKLKVNEPGDIYEREADRIADQVMATPAHPTVSGAPPRIQRFSGQPTGQGDTVPASVDHALASPGRPLELALRQDMGQRFGYDFSWVQVHSDAAAEQSAREVNANAYTAGYHIVFGAGRFAPGTHEGRRLIAHELTHVVQQSGADASPARQSKAGSDLIQRSPGESEDAAIGKEIERPELKEWSAKLQKAGYEVFTRQQFDKVEWLKNAIPSKVPRPDLVAVNSKQAKIIVGDVTAGPWSTSDLKPGDLRKLPHDIGGGKESKLHLEKTIDRAQQIARNLPDNLKHCEVVAQDRWWKEGGYSREVTVRRPTLVQRGTGPAGGGGASVTPPTQPETKPTPPAKTEPTPPPTTATPSASTPTPATKTKTNEPTARLGMPGVEPLHVGGPSAKGQAVGGAVVLGAQLKDWIMGMLGDKAQAERVNAALQLKLSYIQSVQQNKPELGAYITIYWRVYRGNEGETVRRFEDISVKTGTTEKEARESRENSLLNVSASPADTETDTRWIPPLQPLSLAEQTPPRPKIAVATFAPGRARLQGVEWGGVSGFDKFGRRSETLSVPKGTEPRFAILSPPTSASFWNGNIRHNTSIGIARQMTADGFLIPVVDDLDAALVFPLNDEALHLLAQGQGIKDNLKQLQGDFEMTRWVPTNAIQIVHVLDSAEVSRPPLTKEEKMQRRVDFLPMNARELLQRMGTDRGAKLALTPKALERFEQIVPFDLSDEELRELTHRLEPVGDRSIDGVLDDLEKSIVSLPGRSASAPPQTAATSGGGESGISVSASEKAPAREYKPTKLGFEIVGGVKRKQYQGQVIKVDRAALIQGTMVTLAGVEVVVQNRVFIPNQRNPEKVEVHLEVTKNQYFDIEKEYGAEVVKKIGYKSFEYKKGVKFSYTLQLKAGKAE